MFMAAATVFGTCHRLEPLPPEKRSMWNREMDCLLSICEYIVEFSPTVQAMPDGSTHDVIIHQHHTSQKKTNPDTLSTSADDLCDFAGDGNLTKVGHSDEPSSS
jgi:hypothetical protein